MSLRLATNPTGPVPPRVRARWVLPALVVLAWLVFGTVTANFPGRLSQVQTNDGAAFLPAGAEATEVAHLQERFAGGKIQPALVVYERATPSPAPIARRSPRLPRRSGTCMGSRGR